MLLLSATKLSENIRVGDDKHTPSREGPTADQPGKHVTRITLGNARSTCGVDCQLWTIHTPPTHGFARSESTGFGANIILCSSAARPPDASLCLAGPKAGCCPSGAPAPTPVVGTPHDGEGRTSDCLRAPVFSTYTEGTTPRPHTLDAIKATTYQRRYKKNNGNVRATQSITLCHSVNKWCT